MKTRIKVTFFAAAILFSVSACQSHQAAQAGDTTKTDSSSSLKSTIDTTVKIDTGKSKTDSTKKDSTRKDTVSKTITKNVEVKKTVIKKKVTN